MLGDNYSGFPSLCCAKKDSEVTTPDRRACRSTQFSRSLSFGMPGSAGAVFGRSFSFFINHQSQA